MRDGGQRTQCDAEYLLVAYRLWVSSVPHYCCVLWNCWADSSPLELSKKLFWLMMMMALHAICMNEVCCCAYHFLKESREWSTGHPVCFTRVSVETPGPKSQPCKDTFQPAKLQRALITCCVDKYRW